MTKDEVIKYLLDKKIIKEENDNYTFITKQPSPSICKNLPKKYMGISITQAMNLFFDDCELGFTEGKLKYDLRTTSKEAQRIFNGILKDNSIDFTILLDKTKAYYRDSTTVKVPMNKYFIEGKWSNVYKLYDINSKSEFTNTTWL